MPVTIVAQIMAKAEHREAVKAELLNMILPTRQEAGCIEYRLHQDCDNQDLFLFFETWQDGESLQRHLQSPHYARYVAAVSDWIANKTVFRMNSIG